MGQVMDKLSEHMKLNTTEDLIDGFGWLVRTISANEEDSDLRLWDMALRARAELKRRGIADKDIEDGIFTD